MGKNILKGKTALVTGGSRGIGKSIAIKLAEMGANIVLNYRSNVSAVEEVIDEIKSFGVEAVAIQGDVSNFKESENLVRETFEKFNSLDILVNNAGITADGLLIRMKEVDFDKVIQVNLKGAFNCIRHVAPIMVKQRKGKIINISSVVGITGNAGQANYAAAKAGIIGLTKSAAKELASRNINVNAVAPGFIETDMTKVLSDKVRQLALNNIPLKKFGKGKDIAEVVGFLASDSSEYITGQVINVDGGMVI
ncbi:3-oxoacyl-[acyl-carrier-protein] reductase [Clostridium rectalis]|uniref:3-oxoacyl-[acyl-carrier-protein] reductase n=1 Tax=Clostridium rectalis TaxID=2040295 RepID=UPI000F631240|nr:3-oxoacyl-[acyl-carrier-protein] reductase [Clostridium rectalis]